MLAAAAASGPRLRRVLVVSAPGLERCLERELQVLGVPGRLEAAPGGVMVHGTGESLWRAVMESRVAESARVLVGDPFHAPTKAALDAGLRRLPWEDFLPIAPARAAQAEAAAGARQEPVEADIVVSSDRSRLYHERMVRERALDAVEHRRRALLAEAAAAAAAAPAARGAGAAALGPASDAGSGGAAASAGGAAASAGGPARDLGFEGAAAGASGARAQPRRQAAATTVRLRLRHDECQVSVDGSGPLHMRGYRKAGGEAPLRESLAAACVMTSPLLRRLTAALHGGEELVLWDPFCGSGTLVLEALAAVLGQPPGDRGRRYPFTRFPCHGEEEEAYGGLLSSTWRPHPAAGSLTLQGTDRSQEQIDRATRNLHRFRRRLWRSDDPGVGAGCGDVGTEVPARIADGGADSDFPCRVHFRQGSLTKVAQKTSMHHHRA
ncbi:unnamed protein product [Prorocentrum cordatum]|uniref:Uncharacterized protein n=1 Tax=Prorocentrum cordatum TaxID=2364126 RepID=A0ABN9SWK9_9DINO|nr:unnamed protein product [Polarella glacialis]